MKLLSLIVFVATAVAAMKGRTLGLETFVAGTVLLVAAWVPWGRWLGGR